MAENQSRGDGVINARFREIKGGSPTPNATYISYLDETAKIPTGIGTSGINGISQLAPDQTTPFKIDRRGFGWLEWIKKTLGMQIPKQPKQAVQPAIDWNATLREEALNLQNIIHENEIRDKEKVK